MQAQLMRQQLQHANAASAAKAAAVTAGVPVVKVPLDAPATVDSSLAGDQDALPAGLGGEGAVPHPFNEDDKGEGDLVVSPLASAGKHSMLPSTVCRAVDLPHGLLVGDAQHSPACTLSMLNKKYGTAQQCLLMWTVLSRSPCWAESGMLHRR